MIKMIMIAMLATPDAQTRSVDFVDLVEVPSNSKEEESSEFDTATLLISVERSLDHHNRKEMRAEFEILTSNWHNWIIENALLCEAKLRKQQVGDKLEDTWEIKSEAKIREKKNEDKLEEAITSSLKAVASKVDADIVKWKFELAIRGWPELPCNAYQVDRLVHCVNDLNPSSTCKIDLDLELQLEALDSLKHSVQ
jgi:hypothetical protein